MINYNFDLEALAVEFDEIEAGAFDLAPVTDFEEDVGEFIRPYSLDETEVDEGERLSDNIYIHRNDTIELYA